MLLVLAFVSFAGSSYAQVFENDDFRVAYQPFTIDGDIGIGPGNESFNEVAITSLGSSTNTVLVTVNMAPGITYIPGTASITNSNPTGEFEILESDISNLAAPVFAVNRNSDATNNWGAGNFASFSFQRLGGCDAVAHSENSGTFKDFIALTYSGGDGSGEDTDPNFGGYDLIAPSLQVDSPILSLPAIVGGTHTREITDINAGTSGVQTGYHTVLLGSEITDYKLFYNGVELSPVDDMANPLVYEYDMTVSPFVDGNPTDSNLEDGDGVFNDGETLVFTEEFSLLSCGSSTADTNVDHRAGWDCYLSDQVVGSVLFGTAVPTLTYNVVQNPREICGINTVIIEITNTGTGEASWAKDVRLSFGMGSNNQLLNIDYNNNNRWSSQRYDQKIFTNFRLGTTTETNISGNISGWTSDVASYVQYGDTQMLEEDTLMMDPDGAGGFSDVDGDTYFDDIAPGDTVTLTYDMQFVDDDVFSCGSGDDRLQDWEHIFFNALTKTQCDVSRITGIDLGYGNIGRDYLLPTLREQDTDTSDGEVFELAISPYFRNAGTAYRHNGHGIFTDDDDNEMLVELDVPAGVTLDASADPALYSQPGGVGTPVFYRTTDLSNGYSNNNNGDDDEFVRFPLVATCATPNPIIVPYKTTYNWYDASGDLCKTNDIHCDTFLPVLLHGCEPCQGPNITAFDSFRITPGYTDNTMTTLVTLDPAIHELDQYLAGDDMRVQAEGFMNSSNNAAETNPLIGDNLHFRQKYDLPAAASLGQETISFIEGEVYFIDASTGLTTPVTALNPPVIIPDPSGSNDFIADFDFSNAIATLDSGTVDNGDEFFIQIDWHFKLDTYYPNNFNVMGFRGRFFTIEPGHSNANAADEVSCDDWGDSVEFTRPYINTSGGSRSFSDCTEALAIDNNNYIRGSIGHLHPGEFRPITAIKQIDYVVPDGIRVLDASQSTTEGTFRASDGDLNLVQIDDNNWRATPVPGSDYRDTDQRGQAAYRTVLTVKGTCELLETTQIDVFTTMDLFPWAHNVYADPAKYGEDLTRIQNLVFSDDGVTSNNQTGAAGNTYANNGIRLTYNAPTYNFQPLAGSNVDGFGPEAFFDLQIVNTSSNDIPFHWVRVPVQGVVVTNASLDVAADGSGGGTPVDPSTEIFTDADGNSYVQVGAVAAGGTKNIRIAATYNFCEQRPIDFELGYDCDAYPIDYTTTTDFCYKEVATIALIPSGSLVQQTLQSQPSTTVDNCTSFVIENEFNAGLKGTVVNPVSTLEPFGGTSALDIVLIESEYPRGSGNWEDITSTVVDLGTGYEIPLTHPDMDVYGGVPGTGAVGVSQDDRKIIIRYTLQTTCDYQSNSPLNFKVNGNAPCGDPAIGDNSRVLSSGIVIDGLSAPYEVFPELSVPDPIDGCGGNFTIVNKSTVKDIVGNPAAITGTQDFASVEIPVGLEYVPGTLANTGGGTDDMTIVSEMPNELIVQYPSGMVDDDTLEFSFDVTPINGICSDAASVSVSNYIETAGTTCSTGAGASCTEAIIQTGSRQDDIEIRKPTPAALTASEATLSETVSTFGYSLATLTIENSGELDMPAGAEFDFYCADAMGQPMGASIFTGNLVGGIPAGGSLTESIEFNGTEACSETTGLVFVMEPSDANCMCAPTQIPMSLVRAAIQAMPDDFITGINQSIVENLFEVNDAFGDDHDDEDILGQGNTVVSSYTQPANGTVFVDPDGTMTFIPEAGWSGETTFEYTITDEAGNTSTTTVTIRIPDGPIVEDDEDLLNAAGPVTMDTPIGDNDTANTLADPSNAIDPSTVNFVDPNATDSNGDGFNDTLVVPGEGTWTVDPAGNVTFVPQAGFTADPTPINYEVNDLGGLTSMNEGTLTITYVKIPPVPQDDFDLDNVAGSTVTVDVFANNQDPSNPNPLVDSDTDGTVDVTSVSLVIPPGATGINVVDGNVTGFNVPGEGTWSVNPFTGATSFIPLPDFTGNPTPVAYTIKDNDGNINAPADNALITITYTCDLPAPTSPDATPVSCVSDANTIGDLVVDNTPMGSTVVWYDAAGNVLSSTTPLTDGVSYFAGFAEDAPSTCISDVSDRLEFVVTINPEPEDPNGDTLQEFCESEMATATLADLEVTTDGQTLTLNYYDTLADYEAEPKVSIPATTLLTDLTDSLVVISQTNAAGCESLDLLTVEVEFVPQANPGVSGVVTATCDTVDLFAALGTADAGGTWSPNLLDGMFDPAVNAAGVYTYTISQELPCEDVTATITVTNDWPTSDCDGDGVTNADEIADGTDPLDSCDLDFTSQTVGADAAWLAGDCDGDGVTNEQEVLDGTDPTDGCDFLTASITETASAAWNKLDCDNDGLSNGDEITAGTDPQNPDSDGDGVIDGTEVTDGTDPLNNCEFDILHQTLTADAAWLAADCDGDGVTNADEIADGTDPLDSCDLDFTSQTVGADAAWLAGDCDGDGVTNEQEVLDGTDPTDGCDFLTASITETASAAWNALDCDNDGLTNGDEITAGTDPQNPDSDGDGVIDGTEVTDGTDPLNNCEFDILHQTLTADAAWLAADCDGDGVTNADEIADGTDPLDSCDLDFTSQTVVADAAWLAGDCDGDGVTNEQEVLDGTDPTDGCDFLTASITETASAAWNALDCDNDGLTNGDEITEGTDPQNPDSDGDGVIDGTEVTDGTSPTDNCDLVVASQTLTADAAWLAADCDGDGVTNADEIADGTDPLDNCDLDFTSQTVGADAAWLAGDCDGDGVTNEQEVLDGTDPTDGCDFLTASITETASAAWNALDCDNDGLTNGDEITEGTDPQNPDSDGDGVIDGTEVTDGTSPTDNCDLVVASQTLTADAAWLAADCDGDGVTNADEIADGTDPLDSCDLDFTSQTVGADAAWLAGDCDGDGVTNEQEVLDGTDPTDGCDFLTASITETASAAWNALDCDNDGLTNGDEITEGTDPQNPDSDGDGVIDGTEVTDGTSPTDNCDLVVASQTLTADAAWLAADCDGDGVTNADEIADGTDPLDNCDLDFTSQTVVADAAWLAGDCDGDGVTNEQEVLDGTDPTDGCDFLTASITLPTSDEWNALDCDDDGLTNGDEITEGTDPQNPDSDGDGVIDGTEVTDGTDPLDICDFDFDHQTVTPVGDWLIADCDGDGVTNGDEIADGTDPLDNCDLDFTSQTVAADAAWLAGDCDGDGVTNEQEVLDGTDPTDGCDFLTASITLPASDEWNALDCDDDGLSNGDEIAIGTDPQNPDSDGDGVIDGTEVTDGTDPLNNCDFDIIHQTITPDAAWLAGDCDGDGVTNEQEVLDDTDILDVCDYNVASQDISTVTDMWNDTDCDGDGVLNGIEVLDGTNPLDLCDYDAASQDLAIATEEWFNTDCDGDGVTNSDEVIDGTDPQDSCSVDATSQTVDPTDIWNETDCDGDGVTNEVEVIDGTDPTDPCDFNTDSQDLDTVSDEWLDLDCDGDGIPNGDETGDEDGDGVPDYTEINNGVLTATDGLEVFDIMTPNGDGLNDVFVIRGIEQYPNNTVRIYNRWGVEVYGVKGYGQDGQYFRGESNGRATVNGDQLLPVGTYYYTIEYTNGDGRLQQLAGPLYLNR
ncbi:gliding motility-associated C-terminal domain-containing protein [Dokdonia sp. Asnod2-E02]|uniref:T9SS type B sorting domain-containing protein n=2 Tax=Dokdonia TaxID=326319 RepID=UPI0038646BFC